MKITYGFKRFVLGTNETGSRFCDCKMRALWSHLDSVSNCKRSPRIKRLSAANLTSDRNLLSPMIFAEDPELRDFVGFLESLKNYEKSGVPKGAGTDSGEGFDLRRMKRLMLNLSNPLISITRFSLVFDLRKFEKENVDIAVIESGLGGARDATYVIESSNLAASVITTIGEEHMAALGSSLETIAEAKSGII